MPLLPWILSLSEPKRYRVLTRYEFSSTRGHPDPAATHLISAMFPKNNPEDQSYEKPHAFKK
jgi:hypothetical protein